MRIERLTCAIGAELLDVNLANAVGDDGLFADIHAALLEHKVLFLRGHPGGPGRQAHPTSLLPG